MSYNNEGILSLNEIKSVMSKRGKYGLFECTYGRLKADKDENRNHKAKSVSEYLHYAICE